MANLISIMVHCDERHSEMMVGDLAHIHLSEGGGSGFIANVHSKQLKNETNGTLNLADIHGGIRWASSYDPHSPKTKLLCLENTHNRCGGTVLTPAYMDSVADLLDESAETLGYRIPIHLDGSRLFNASIAAKCSVAELSERADSVNICFSKGLGC